MPIIQQELRKFFASKGSGDLANTALQPDDIGTIVQAYDQALDAASPFSKDALALADAGAWRDALNIDPDYYNRANILGTVSQSGGVPTGAAFESGSNPNGRFIKYPDGTMICWRYLNFTGLSIPPNFGITGDLGTYTFPASFNNTQVVISGGASVGLSTGRRAGIVSFGTTNNEVISWSGVTVANMSSLSGNATIANVGLVAIGRWY
jgi:hypothetical protein